jgi:hypothetical protein
MDRVTVATVFMNGNYEFSRSALTSILNNQVRQQGRSVHVIASSIANVSSLPFPVKSAHFVSRTDAFNFDYDRLK